MERTTLITNTVAIRYANARIMLNSRYGFLVVVGFFFAPGLL